MSEEIENCIICDETATVGVRGTIAKEYVFTCSFHAGAFQLIFEKLNLHDSVKWRPIPTSIKH